ncbi:hypothetical protein [Chamaesiphon minutus]|uniref:Uncharacterized protein n=1 Tax=Chamaesiphon minutus (strain ATCC 27169 / PCC 6605) TaxID=1173020 RepID=K9UI29_CHAP6|nr:hypothetical protein [Chamaesiphon minutus]AFY93849.1 hypothetical protein Cha6605_2813 [Chamaesiphon minutus PCC 6605]
MSGTYQSRVFTFISKRTDRLKDTCVQGLRHLKVAVVWTGQILLYPLQLLAQKLENLQPRLAPPPPQKSLPQPASDINIEQALESIVEAGYPIEIADSAELIVDDWSVIDENIWNNGGELIANQSQEATYNFHTSSQVRSHKPIIRGLSSLLTDRQLVLVTAENELLDLLTVSQQQEIRRRIGLDIAIAWHQWRASKIATDRAAPEFSTDRQQVLLDETTDRWLEIEREHLTNPTLFLNSEIDPIEPALPSTTLRDRLQNWWQNATKDRAESQPVAPKAQLELPSSNYPFTPRSPRLNRFVDLPQLPPIVESQPTPNQARPVLDTLAKLQPNWLKSWFSYYQDYLYIPSKQDSYIVHQPAEFKLIPIEPEPQKIEYTEIIKRQNSSLNKRGSENKQAAGKISKQIDLESEVSQDWAGGKISKQVNLDPEYFPDWIEADSELIGYSRSPLARFLAWLDRIVLAIENWLIKMWEMITNNPARN